MSTAVRIDLFGVKVERTGKREQLGAQGPGSGDLADLGQCRDQPKRADGERTLLTAEAVVYFLDPVTQNQFVFGELVRYGQDRSPQAWIVRREKPE